MAGRSAGCGPDRGCRRSTPSSVAGSPACTAVIAGVLVTAVAALLPAQALRRLPAAHLLAQE
jgi:hypothetical protein